MMGRCGLDASHWEQWPVADLVNTVMDFRVPKKMGIFLNTPVTI